MINQEWISHFITGHESWIEDYPLADDHGECKAKASRLAETADHHKALLLFLERCLNAGLYSVKSSLEKYAQHITWHCGADKTNILIGAVDKTCSYLRGELTGDRENHRATYGEWLVLMGEYADMDLSQESMTIVNAHSAIRYTAIPFNERGWIAQDRITTRDALQEAERKNTTAFANVARRVAAYTIQTAKFQAMGLVRIEGERQGLDFCTEILPDRDMAGIGAVCGALDEMRQNLITALQASQTRT